MSDIIKTLACFAAVVDSTPASDTAFAKLSMEAQDFIVEALLGGDLPENMSERVKDEIRAWASVNEEDTE